MPVSVNQTRKTTLPAPATAAAIDATLSAGSFLGTARKVAMPMHVNTTFSQTIFDCQNGFVGADAVAGAEVDACIAGGYLQLLRFNLSELTLDDVAAVSLADRV